jgi:hypothetical protein
VVRVACLPDAPDVILGYLVREGHIVHWAYVKKPFRRLGILRALAAGVPPDFLYTHRTIDAEPIVRRFPQSSYDPYPL